MVPPVSVRAKLVGALSYVTLLIHNASENQGPRRREGHTTVRPDIPAPLVSSQPRLQHGLGQCFDEHRHAVRLPQLGARLPPAAPSRASPARPWSRRAGGLSNSTHFVSERRTALSRKTAWVIIRDSGRDAGLGVASHPHMLRHACGYALADQGADTRLIQDYPGHRNIHLTVRYTATNPAWFERLWR